MKLLLVLCALCAIAVSDHVFVVDYKQGSGFIPAQIDIGEDTTTLQLTYYTTAPSVSSVSSPNVASASPSSTSDVQGFRSLRLVSRDGNSVPVTLSFAQIANVQEDTTEDTPALSFSAVEAGDDSTNTTVVIKDPANSPETDGSIFQIFLLISSPDGDYPFLDGYGQELVNSQALPYIQNIDYEPTFEDGHMVTAAYAVNVDIMGGASLPPVYNEETYEAAVKVVADKLKTTSGSKFPVDVRLVFAGNATDDIEQMRTTHGIPTVLPRHEQYLKDGLYELLGSLHGAQRLISREPRRHHGRDVMRVLPSDERQAARDESPSLLATRTTRHQAERGRLARLRQHVKHGGDSLSVDDSQPHHRARAHHHHRARAHHHSDFRFRQHGGIASRVREIQDRFGLPGSKTNLVGGVNVGPDLAEWGGTMGGFFRDCNDVLYGVTNSHVLAPSGKPQNPVAIGTNVCQPGKSTTADLRANLRHVTSLAYNAGTGKAKVIGHNYAVNDQITIAGVATLARQAYNNNFQVNNVLDNDVFEFAMGVNPGGGVDDQHGDPAVTSQLLVPAGNCLAIGQKKRSKYEAGGVGHTFDWAVFEVDFTARPQVKCAIGGGIGMVTAKGAPALNDVVHKFGYRTHYTTGRISAIHANPDQNNGIRGHMEIRADSLPTFPNAHLPNVLNVNDGVSAPWNENPGWHDLVIRELTGTLKEQVMHRTVEVATITCASTARVTVANHRFLAGDQVRLVGAGAYTATVTVAPLPALGTFDYALANCLSPLAANTGTVRTAGAVVTSLRVAGTLTTATVNTAINHNFLAGDTLVFVRTASGAPFAALPKTDLTYIVGPNPAARSFTLTGVTALTAGGQNIFNGDVTVKRALVLGGIVCNNMVATATTTNNHPFQTNDMISLAGDPKFRTGLPVQITRPGGPAVPTSIFTYTPATAPNAAAAVAVITAVFTVERQATLTCQTFASFTTGGANTYKVGSLVSVQCGASPNFAVVDTPIRTVNGNTFTYPIPCGVTPAGGPATVTRIKVAVQTFSALALVGTLTTATAAPFAMNDQIVLTGIGDVNYDNQAFAVINCVGVTVTITLLNNVPIQVDFNGLNMFAHRVDNAVSNANPTSALLIVTVATVGNHGALQGDTVTVAGATQIQFNGPFLVFEIVNVNTFKYFLPALQNPAVAQATTITVIKVTRSKELPVTITQPGGAVALVTTVNNVAHQAFQNDMIQVYGVTMATPSYSGKFIIQLQALAYTCTYILRNIPALEVLPVAQLTALKSFGLVMNCPANWAANVLTIQSANHGLIVGDTIRITAISNVNAFSTNGYIGDPAVTLAVTAADPVAGTFGVTGNDPGLGFRLGQNLHYHRAPSNAEITQISLDLVAHNLVRMFGAGGDSGSFIMRATTVVGLLVAGTWKHDRQGSPEFVTVFGQEWGAMVRSQFAFSIQSVLDSVHDAYGIAAGTFDVCTTANNPLPGACVRDGAICHPQTWCETNGPGCQLRVLPP